MKVTEKNRLLVVGAFLCVLGYSELQIVTVQFRSLLHSNTTISQKAIHKYVYIYTYLHIDTQREIPTGILRLIIRAHQTRFWIAHVPFLWYQRVQDCPSTVWWPRINFTSPVASCFTRRRPWKWPREALVNSCTSSPKLPMQKSESPTARITCWIWQNCWKKNAQLGLDKGFSSRGWDAQWPTHRPTYVRAKGCNSLQ